MIANLVIFPIVIPLATAILSLLAPPRLRANSVIGVAGLAANLCTILTIAGIVLAEGQHILVLQAGDWPAPFGISVVVDGFSAILLIAVALVLLATYLYCQEQLRSTADGLFHPLFHLLAMGVQWSLITGDLFNLFVAFEIMLMASYALLVLGTSRQQMRQAYKYVMINLFGSTLFVTACGLIYGHLGTLNLADLARLSHAGLVPAGAVPAICVLLLVFGLKSAIFPLWFWLPDTYPTVPAGLGALLGGLLTKVGAYVMIRIFVMVFGPAGGAVAEVIGPILLVVAALTMFLGVLGAVSMNSVRRILSIHIISQVGYMVMAAALGIGIGMTTENRTLAVAGGIFFIFHNIIVKSSLFLCGGLMSRYAGSDALDRMGGLAKQAPWLAAMFLIAALSLAGLPPLSGFFAKFVLVREAMRGQYHALAAVALGTSVLTLLSMVKIWSFSFWSRPAAGQPDKPPPTATAGMMGTGILVIATIAAGLASEPAMRLSSRAAQTLVEPSAYINAVLDARQIHPIRIASDVQRGDERP